MRRLLPLLLCLALPAALVRAGEEEPDPWLRFDGATVLASPGAPRGLDSFLPGGARPKPLTWPLPDGPLVVLGLPATDPIARQIGEAFELAVSPHDLAGGYRLFAWRDGERPIAFLFGADPAALYAARFEFDASAPAEMMAPDMRSLDFKRPNEEAGCLVLSGERAGRPRYAMRAFAPGADVDEGTASVAAGARANRLWIDPAAVGQERAEALVAEARAQGVTPVIVGHLPTPLVNAILGTAPLIAAWRAWQERAGVRHFALLFRPFPADWAPSPEEDWTLEETNPAGFLARDLRRDGLDELIVVPRCHSDDLARTHGAPPDLRTIPEAVIAWSGPHEHSTRITRADAERRVREAGVPVVLLETWAAPFQGDDHAAYLPVAPTGRDADLPEVLDGIVVLGARGTAQILESAWAPAGDNPFGPQLLAPLLPTRAPDVGTFLTKAAMRIEKEAADTMGLVPWMGPLAEHARETAALIHLGQQALGVPVVPAATTFDGKLDEPAWGFARAIETGRPDTTLLVLSDGASLRFGARVKRTGGNELDALLTLHVKAGSGPWDYSLWISGAGAGAARGESIGDEEPVHAQFAQHGTRTHVTAEFALDRFALSGEAHPLRTFDIGLGGVGPDRSDFAALQLVVTR